MDTHSADQPVMGDINMVVAVIDANNKKNKNHLKTNKQTNREKN